MVDEGRMTMDREDGLQLSQAVSVGRLLSSIARDQSNSLSPYAVHFHGRDVCIATFGEERARIKPWGKADGL